MTDYEEMAENDVGQYIFNDALYRCIFDKTPSVQHFNKKGEVCAEPDYYKLDIELEHPWLCIEVSWIKSNGEAKILSYDMRLSED